MRISDYAGLKNFAVFFACAMLLLLGLSFLKTYLQAAALGAGTAGMLVLLAKSSMKFLPLIMASLVELVLARHARLTLRHYFCWKKTHRVDLYCFLLTHVHKLIGLLHITFTLGIPFLLDRLIARQIPAEFSLYFLIEHHAGTIVAALAFVTAASFFTYWEHRMWHTSVMWPIHRFHHSATEFSALTETRKHFTEILLTPLFFTLPMSLLGAPLEFMVAYLTLILFQGFMNHSSQDISYGWIGRNLWIDPAYHKLHHSIAPEHMNKNYSGTLPVWDRLFGTYMYENRAIVVGVTDAEHYANLPYWKIYIKDFSDFLGNIRSCARNSLGRCGIMAQARTDL